MAGKGIDVNVLLNVIFVVSIKSGVAVIVFKSFLFVKLHGC